MKHEQQTSPAYGAYEAALLALVEQDGMKEALSAVTASFVGLTLMALEHNVDDFDGGEVRIDGGPTSRDITIHAPKVPQ